MDKDLQDLLKLIEKKLEVEQSEDTLNIGINDVLEVKVTNKTTGKTIKIPGDMFLVFNTNNKGTGAYLVGKENFDSKVNLLESIDTVATELREELLLKALRRSKYAR